MLVKSLAEKGGQNSSGSPCGDIPILLEEEIEIEPDLYFVLAWNFKKEILAKHDNLIKQGVEFYFPINPKE